MTLYRLAIRPQGPFFLGQNSHARKSGALIHSDTLHGALLSVAALSGSPLLHHAQSLRVSSVFPSWKGIHFYPRPFLAVPRNPNDEDAAGRKRWKKIHLVSEALLKAWLRNDAAIQHETEDLGSGLAALRQELDGRHLPLNGFLTRDDLAPAVTVDRVALNATPYDRRGLRLNTDEGVRAWFLAEVDGMHQKAFCDLVALLGDHGLGGERSVGYGRFALELAEEVADETLVNFPPEANAALTLSLYHPTREEVAAGALDGIAAYACALRGGWIHGTAGTDRAKLTLRMCVEGSVFPLLDGTPPLGDVCDVRPAGFDAHPVWRSGLALTIPFHWQPQSNGRVSP